MKMASGSNSGSRNALSLKEKLEGIKVRQEAPQGKCKTTSWEIQLWKNSDSRYSEKQG